MLPKLCHLDNDLEITIMKHYHYTVYILCSTHDLHTLPGDIFFSHGTPVWPRPVIYIYIFIIYDIYYNYMRQIIPKSEIIILT